MYNASISFEFYSSHIRMSMDVNKKRKKRTIKWEINEKKNSSHLFIATTTQSAIVLVPSRFIRTYECVCACVCFCLCAYARIHYKYIVRTAPYWCEKWIIIIAGMKKKNKHNVFAGGFQSKLTPPFIRTQGRRIGEKGHDGRMRVLRYGTERWQSKNGPSRYPTHDSLKFK